MSVSDPNSPQFLFSIAGIGAVLGLCQLLATGERVTAWRAIGRAGVTAGFSVAGCVMFLAVPSMTVAPAVGLAALLASLGTSGLERVADRFLGPKAATPPKDTP
jgi:hypothetical protein